MRLLASAGLAALLLLTACGGDAGSAPQVTVEDAWIRLPAVAGRPAAGYFTATANQEGEILRSVAAPAPARVELHESMMHDGMASMHPVETVPLDKGKPLAFAPGSKHLMLFDLDPGLAPGDTIDLTLTFAKAPPVTVAAEVLAAGDPPPQ